MTRRVSRGRCSACFAISARLIRYNVTELELKALLAKKRCQCCNSPFKSPSSRNIDHCKKTGVVRGVLCMSCNISVGNIKEDPRRAEMLKKYILNKCKPHNANTKRKKRT